MTSSLAQQLSQVRSFNATQLGNAKQSSRFLSASYLFPPNVASTQDLQTLQALGANGWEELAELDAMFSKWNKATGAGDLLFGSTSRDYDRLMKSKEENQGLDKAIVEFLHLIGGNLLDRSTGKCLEWLVRRFRVQEYNVEMILATFMPYHETPEFARMLQLLNLKDKSIFAFLLPVQKQAVSLPSSILISSMLNTSANSNRMNVLRWVVGLLSPKSTSRFHRSNHSLETFWFSIIIKICDKFRNGQIARDKNASDAEKQDMEQLYLSVLLPASVDAAIGKQMGLDCQIGGCIALCMISTSFSLSEEARDSVAQSLGQAEMEGARLEKVYQATIKLLCSDDDKEDGERKGVWLSEEALSPVKELVSIKATSELSPLKDESILSDEYEALKSIVDLQDEESVFAIASKVCKSFKERLNNWASIDVLSSSSSENFVEEEIKNLQKAISKRPYSRKTATKVEAHLLSQMSLKVETQKYTAIVSMSDLSSLAAMVYSLAISAAFVNPSVSSSLVTALFMQLGDASLTFLASIWTTTKNSLELRYVALHHAQSYLAAFLNEDAHIRNVDFQAILPSLVIGLKDIQSSIRKASIDCIELVAVALAKIEKNCKAGSKVEVYGFDSIYGQNSSSKLRYLDIADTLRFTKSLMRVQTSFHHDTVYMNAWFQSNLNVVRGEGKRESSYKSRITEFLLSHVISSTNISSKICLLDALTEVHDPIKLQMLLPLLQEFVSNSNEIAGEEAEDYISLLFEIFDASAIDNLEIDEDGSWTFFMSMLNGDSAHLLKCVALRLQKGLFARLPSTKKREIYAKLAEVIVGASTPLPKEVKSCLISLDISTDDLVPILSEKREIIIENVIKSAGRQGKKSKTQENLDDESKWTESLSIIFEILESTLSRKVRLESAALLLECVEMLRLGTELLLSTQSRGEYLMQIGMSNLSFLIDQVISMEDLKVKQEVMAAIRIDTIVNVIKTPCRPQTFQQALLLLSKLGKMAPDLVLHNAMPIFTFVGSTMLQRDDDYSFIVIEKTLQSILPAVIKQISSKCNESNDQLAWLQGVQPLLCVFTDAAKHVPRHRRISFFSVLIQILGVDYLAPICMLLTDRLATKVFKQSENSDIAEIQTTLQLPLSLIASNANVAKSQQCLRSLNLIWDEVDRHWTNRQMDPLALQKLIFLDCTAPLGGGSEHEGRRANPIRKITALIRLIHITILAKSDDLEDTLRKKDVIKQQSTREEEKALWYFIERALLMSQVDQQSIRRASSDVLERVMMIAPLHVIFEVIMTLLKSSQDLEKQRGLHLCTQSIASMSRGDRNKAAAFTCVVIEECYNLVKKGGELVSYALETLICISESCTPSEHIALSAGLNILTEGSKSGSEQSLHLLVVLSKQLGPRLIPHLKSILSMTTDIIKSPITKDNILTLSLDLLSSLVRAVPVFMASHVDDIIHIFVENFEMQNLPQASSLLSSIVRSITPAELLPRIISMWEKGKKSSLALHTTCLNILERIIKNSDRKAIMASYKIVFRYLLILFDIRRNCQVDSAQWTFNMQDVLSIEDRAVTVFLQLILKLNENTFRPLFLRFCDWTLIDLADEEEESSSHGTSKDILARKVILYKVMNALMAELGEFVIGYYSNILDATMETMQGYAEGHVEGHDELWKLMISSLQKSTRADRGKGDFWNENRAKVVMPHLTSQLGLRNVTSASNEQLLGQCVADLCRTVPDESILKLANKLLLGKIQSEHIGIKIASIGILERVWRSKECEDVLLRLVPETVPSIAGLLQDSNKGIQSVLSSLVIAIEKVLGENLDGYLQ